MDLGFLFAVNLKYSEDYDDLSYTHSRVAVPLREMLNVLTLYRGSSWSRIGSERNIVMSYIILYTLYIKMIMYIEIEERKLSKK